MYLKKVEINGFKSFARKTILEFEKGITTIVGPNGSGKSNVAEAIKWVMGEQSVKSLRGEKSTDVIFSGTDKASKLGMAEVSLHIKNENPEPDSKQDDDSKISSIKNFSEFTITRKLYRDGKSEYLFNGQNVRLHDIQLLLAEINLSSKTYSVIGQGMIDEVLSYSISERKDFFEEATGVKPLQIKKNESLKKLENTFKNLEEVQIQMNEIVPRLNSLTRQVKKLEKKSEIENKLYDIQYKYYGQELYTLNQKYKNLKDKETGITSKIQTIENNIKKLQEKIFTYTKQENHSKKLSELQIQYQKLMNQKGELQNKLVILKNKQFQSSQKTQQSLIPSNVVENIYKKIDLSIKSLIQQSEDENDISKIKKIIKKHTEEIYSFFKLVSQYWSTKKEDSGDISSTIETTEKSISEIDKKISQLSAEMNNLASQESEEKSMIWDYQKKLQNKQIELNQLSNERNTYRIEIAKIDTRISDIEREITTEMGEEFLIKINNWDSSNQNPNHYELYNEIHKLKHQLSLIGGIDPMVKEEYNEVKERYEFLKKQTDDLKQASNNLIKLIEDLNKEITKKFNQSFHKINDKFKSFFQFLFNGGKAELKLIRQTADEEKENNDDEEVDSKKSILKYAKSSNDEIIGVDIHSTPPGKKLKSISMLSGGERALTAIALICAIIANNPAPFVVLDEVDAALDEANSIRFADIIYSLSEQSQFVVITHNRATMEKSNILYGITMGDNGISQLLSLKLEEAKKYVNR